MSLKSTPAPKRSRSRKVRPKRPSDLLGALDRINLDHKPPFVPDDATLLVAWIDLPGDNTQRTQHWAVKRHWQEQLKTDMGDCLAAQRHPGVLERPQVHIKLLVAGKGDERNLGGRAKYVIDRLQVRREIDYVREGKRGTRVFGGFDLITDDKVLTEQNCTIEEIRTPDAAERKVLVWIWEREAV